MELRTSMPPAYDIPEAWNGDLQWLQTMATQRGYFSDFDLNGDDLSPDWEAMNILTPYAAAVYYYDKNDVQDTLAYIPITITRYTCGIPTPTIQTSTNCPTLTWTTRSPIGTTTGVCLH